MTDDIYKKYNIEELIVELINTKKQLKDTRADSDHWQRMYTIEVNKILDMEYKNDRRLLADRNRWRDVSDSFFHAYVIGSKSQEEAFQQYLDACANNYEA